MRIAAILAVIGVASCQNDNVSATVDMTKAYCRSYTVDENSQEVFACYNLKSDEWINVPKRLGFHCEQDGQECPIEHNFDSTTAFCRDYSVDEEGKRVFACYNDGSDEWINVPTRLGFHCEEDGQECPIIHNQDPAKAFCTVANWGNGEGFVCYNEESDEFINVPSRLGFSCESEGQECPIHHNLDAEKAYCTATRWGNGEGFVCYNEESDEFINVPESYGFSCETEGQECPIHHNVENNGGDQPNTPSA